MCLRGRCLTLAVLFVSILCQRADAEIRVDRVESTSRQILVRYTLPDDEAAAVCTWSATRLDGSPAAVIDVDTTLYPGADQDVRTPQLAQGTHRIFVLGRPLSERATDQYVYSRALKAATKYRLEGRCGNDTVAVEATTQTVPFGKTRGEPFPADPDNPGEYLHPSRKWSVAGQDIIDPQTGVELTFPNAAGVNSTAITAPFKQATSAAWTNPGAALRQSDSRAAATFSRAAAPAAAAVEVSANLYLQWDYDRFGNIAGDGSAKTYDAGGLDYLQLDIAGSGSAGNEADRTVQIALTFDGVNPAVPWQDVVLDRSESTKTVGSGKLGDTLQGPGKPPIPRVNFAGRSGTLTYDAATKTATLRSGTSAPTWSAGTTLRIADAPIDRMIEDATYTSPVTIQLPSHGLSTNDTVEIKNVIGNTNANGTWTVSVLDADHFNLIGSTANAPYGGGRMAQSQVIDVIPGTPCKILVDLNQAIGDGDRIKITELGGIQGVVGSTYVVTVANGSGGQPVSSGKLLTLEDSSCSGGFDNSSYGRGNSNGRLFKMSGVAQRLFTFPIASMPSGSAVILQNGPEASTAASTLAAAVAADDSAITLQAGAGASFRPGMKLAVDSEQMKVTAVNGDVLQVTRACANTGAAAHAAQAAVLEVKDWKVEPFGVLVRKKTASADTVSIDYAAMKFSVSPGVPWTATGTSRCSVGLVAGPDGKMGYVCDIGGPRWVAADGSEVTQWGNIVNYIDTDVQVGNGCFGKAATQMGAMGINPKDPKRVYCFPWVPARLERYVIVAEYEGDFRNWTPQPDNYYYPGYVGSFSEAPVLPNCYGFGKFNDGRNPRLQAFADGTPCVSYKRYATSLKDLLRDYGRQLWKKQNPDLNKVNCTVDTNSLTAVWNEAHEKVHVAIKCIGGQDDPAVAYIFEIDDDKETVTPIGEVSSFDRDGITWAGVHGGFTLSDVADGYLTLTPYPLALNNYTVDFSNKRWLQGPYWAGYTAVNGVQDMPITNGTGGTGLISCAPWAGSPYLPSPTPDGAGTMVNGALAGCTTLTLTSEPCDDSLNDDQLAVIASDPQTHVQKCGAPNKFWLQDLRVGDMVAIDNDVPGTFYAKFENARVIAKTGSGPGAQVTLYRGGVVPLAGGVYGYAAGAKTYAGVKNRRIIAWMNHPDSGVYPTNFVDYMNHATDQGGGQWVTGYGHGIRTRAGVAGADGNNYAVVLGGFDRQKTAINPDFRIPNIVPFAGKTPNSINTIDSHITWVPSAQGDSQYPWIVDGRPWEGYDGTQGTLVAGTTSVYRFPKSVWSQSSSTYIWPKFLPVAARVGTSVLRSVSGPNSVIDDSTAYTFCYAFKPCECRPDSKADDLYVSAPNVAIPAGRYQCCDKDLTTVRDIAFTSATSVLSCYTQTLLVADPTGGATRCLTTGFDHYRIEDPYKNWSVTPNGRTGIGRTRGLEQVKSEIWTADLPPVHTDAWNRTTWIQAPVDIPAYNGADNVIVEFGYEQFGKPAAEEYFCIDRREACVVAAGTTSENPYYFASESYNGIPCASGCRVEIPAVADSVVYYRIRYRSGTNNVYAAPGALTTP